MLEIIFYSVLIMTASLIGVFSIWRKAGKTVERNLHFLISFSAGVFLIISYQLIIEVMHEGSNISSSIFWVLLGMVGIWFLFKIIPEFHNHEEAHAHDHEHKDILEENTENDHFKNHENKIDSRKVILTDAMHNIGDGILLAAAFTISSPFGIMTAISIFIHELIQEVSEFFILRQSGFSTKKALKINFLASSTILIGSIGGFLLLGYFEILEVPLLGIAGGAFLVVVLQDLIPHSVKNSISNKHHFKHIFWFIIGATLMFTVNSQFSHEHDYDDDHHDEEYLDDNHSEDHHEDEIVKI